jgi:hypothetical protein
VFWPGRRKIHGVVVLLLLFDTAILIMIALVVMCHVVLFRI